MKRALRVLKWTHAVWNENKEYWNADIRRGIYVSMTYYIHIVRKSYHRHWNRWVSAGLKAFWSYFITFVRKSVNFDYTWGAVSDKCPVDWLPNSQRVQEVQHIFDFVHILSHSNKLFNRFKKWPRNETKKTLSLSRGWSADNEIRKVLKMVTVWLCNDTEWTYSRKTQLRPTEQGRYVKTKRLNSLECWAGRQIRKAYF